VTGLRVERESAYLRLDAVSRRNLEITETLRGEAAPTLFALLDTCATTMGSRLLRHTLHNPLRDRAPLSARLDAVATLAGVSGAGPYAQLRKLLDDVADVERITARISLRSARPRDLTGLRATLSLLPEVQEVLASAASPRLAELAIGAARRLELVDLLTRAIKADPSSLVREGGVIAACAHRHSELESRVQPRARLLHRGHAGAGGQGAARLSPSPDAQERRALYHAGAKEFRGQSVVGTGSCACARETAL
jgi:DNA mismatch repair protein MutS